MNIFKRSGRPRYDSNSSLDAKFSFDERHSKAFNVFNILASAASAGPGDLSPRCQVGHPSKVNVFQMESVYLAAAGLELLEQMKNGTFNGSNITPAQDTVIRSWLFYLLSFLKNHCQLAGSHVEAEPDVSRWEKQEGALSCCIVSILGFFLTRRTRLGLA